MPVIKSIFAFFILLLPHASEAQEKADTALSGTVFWKITGKDLKEPSYLMGTAHPVFREDIFIPDTISKALFHSRVLYVENIPPTENEYRARMLMDRNRLPSLLGQDCYNRLWEYLQNCPDSLQSDPAKDQFSPLYYIDRILAFYYNRRLSSIDLMLISIATGNDQPVMALDPTNLNQKLQHRITYPELAANLCFILDNLKENLDDYERFIKKMTAYYLQGEIGRLYTTGNYIRVTDNATGSSVLQRRSSSIELLDQRNKAWLPEMINACREGNAFFAVGVLHLAGQKGLIRLLGKKGYELTPVMIRE